MRRLAPLLVLLAGLLAPAAAQAALFTGQTIDGPNPDIVSVGAVAIAPDGTGGVVYLRRDGGVPHVFVSRLVGGRWESPVRIDASLPGTASQPVLATGGGGRLVAGFVSDGAVYAAVRPGGRTVWQAPVALAPSGSDPSVSMSMHGVGYLTFTSAGAIRAAYLPRTASTPALLPAALNLDASRPAGDTADARSQVATSADGTALAVWGERAADGEHAVSRRILRDQIGQAPQDLTVSSLSGHGGGPADQPDVAIEWDASFAWVVDRQVVDGVPRGVARMLRGSQYDDPELIDGGAFPPSGAAATPSVALTGKGDGLAATAVQDAAHDVIGAPLLPNDADVTQQDVFGQGQLRLNGSANAVTDPQPRAAISDDGVGAATWLASSGGGDPVELHGRIYDGSAGNFLGERLFTVPALGAVDPAAGTSVAADRLGDLAAVTVQDGPAGRRLVTAMFDQPPGFFSLYTGQACCQPRRPKLSWRRLSDLWGVVYTVRLDGRVLVRTTASSYVPPKPLRPGTHHWRVIATDAHGQTAETDLRILRIARR